MNIYKAWEVMGLTPGCGKADLESAYRRKIKEYHPDLCSRNGMSKEEATAKTVELTEARDLLESAVCWDGFDEWGVPAMGSRDAVQSKPDMSPLEGKTDAPEAHSDARSEKPPASVAEETPDVNHCNHFGKNPEKATQDRGRTDAEGPERAFRQLVWRMADIFFSLDSSVAAWLLSLTFLIACWYLPFRQIFLHDSNPLNLSGFTWVLAYCVLPFASLADFVFPLHIVPRIVLSVPLSLARSIRN